MTLRSPATIRVAIANVRQRSEAGCGSRANDSETFLPSASRSATWPSALPKRRAKSGKACGWNARSARLSGYQRNGG